MLPPTRLCFLPVNGRKGVDGKSCPCPLKRVSGFEVLKHSLPNNLPKMFLLCVCVVNVCQCLQPTRSDGC